MGDELVDQRTELVRTDDGYVVNLIRVVGTQGITRRDDLRGCWEVNGTIYATRDEAIAAAETALAKG